MSSIYSSFSIIGIDHAKRSPYTIKIFCCVGKYNFLLNILSYFFLLFYTLHRFSRLGCFPCFSQLIFFSHISAQLTCDGTETFEKISGVNISSARLTPLYSEAGGTVTAQCNNRYEITKWRGNSLYSSPHFLSFITFVKWVSNWIIGVSARQSKEMHSKIWGSLWSCI